MSNDFDRLFNESHVVEALRQLEDKGILVNNQESFRTVREICKSFYRQGVNVALRDSVNDLLNKQYEGF